MNILEKFKVIGEGKNVTIGIGIGEQDSHNFKILNAILDILGNYELNIYLFGKKSAIDYLIRSHNKKIDKNNLKFIKNEDPEKTIISFLKDGKIRAVIRGSLSSSNFLKSIKEILNFSEIHRLTLLETYDGYQFFYGPVGIDECNTFEKKRDFILKAIPIFNLLKIDLKVSILSGGRKGDIGRDEAVDKSITLANDVVNFFKREYPSLIIDHDEILIEKSIEKRSNLIIAPDGISGNLIYRTLVHLGGGKAYGAIYLDTNYIIIDTSRVGNISEITGALYLALALTN
ncbi:MAG: methanogenesis marker protein Mmp4/MtxX [Promethearchaeota archaeon]